MTNKQKEILRAYAECNMSSIEAGKVLFMTKQNVLYHLGQIREATGKDPHKFCDLLELLIYIDGDKSGFAKVVRCRDCKHWGSRTENEKGFIVCPASGMKIHTEAFCSYGERRNDEH